MRSPITFVRQPLAIESVAAHRRALRLDPLYQRQGDVWTKSRQRLFIDSVLNGFVVPPMYWHALGAGSERTGTAHRYAVVDGRQRLEALYAFLDGDLRLADDNKLLAEPEIALDGMTIADLRHAAPWVYAAFMRASLDVVIIETDDVDLIEELFSRLNDGVPLSAAEKRNRGRLLAPLVREFVDSHRFFSDILPFGNGRYRHFDLLAKLMLVEDVGIEEGRVPNLRKGDLDALFKRLRDESESADDDQPISSILDAVSAVLDRLAEIFQPKDPFLSSVGMVTVYYAAEHYLAAEHQQLLSRQDIEHFEGLREAVKGAADEELSDNERRAEEFARYAQGTTSGTHLTARLRLLLAVLRDLETQP